MRKKKKYYVLTFATTTHALAMESKCSEKGIPGRLIPIPGQITAGCGLAWRIPSADYNLYDTEIQMLHIPFENIVELLL